MNIHRSIAYFKEVSRSDSAPETEVSYMDRLVAIPYSDDFAIFFLVDTGDSYRFVQTKHLEGVATKKELLVWGIENLRKVLQGIQIAKKDGVIYFRGSGDFEATLLLVPELWEQHLADHCPNGFLAVIPARDILAVCDKSDQQAIHILNSIVEKIWPPDDHPLSKSFYERVGNTWKPVKA